MEYADGTELEFSQPWAKSWLVTRSPEFVEEDSMTRNPTPCNTTRTQNGEPLNVVADGRGGWVVGDHGPCTREPAPNPFYCPTCGARTDFPSSHCA